MRFRQRIDLRGSPSDIFTALTASRSALERRIGWSELFLPESVTLQIRRSTNRHLSALFSW
jgi:hypothetical protein